MPEISPGEIFDGRYEIIKVLGVGGLGIVYMAKQLEFQRIVALKVLHPNVLIDEEFKLRMQREAQALNQLAHPNIVTIYHLGLSIDEQPYIAMEYIQGKSLRAEILESEKIPVERALKIIKDAAEALDFVHQQEIVHRDIKPDNLILVQEPEPDTVKLIDFGLARFTDDQKQKLTGTGDLIGTAQYMSPEQCAGKRADKRSDIYSLTLCLYEILTGDSPFSADTPVAVMYKHLNSIVPEIKTGSIKNFSPAINAILQKGLAKEPEKRYQSMAELANAIDAVDGSRVNAKSAGIRLNPWLIIVLLITLPLAIWFTLKKSSEPVKIAIAPSRRLQRFTESVIESEMLRGNREKAKSMCESTLGFPTIPITQRGRILIQLAQLTREFEPTVAYQEAARVLQNHRAEKLHCYMNLVGAFMRERLPHSANFFYHKLENDLKKYGQVEHDRDLYSFNDMQHKMAITSMMDGTDCKPLNPSFDKYFKTIEPLLIAEDETECFGTIAREAFKANRIDVVEKLIAAAKESNPQVEITLACLDYLRPDLARKALNKAKAAPIYTDGHKPARELQKLIAEARYYLDIDQKAEARKLLSENTVSLVKLCKRDERAVELNFLPAVMYLSGLDMKAIWDAIGEKNTEISESTYRKMSDSERQTATAKAKACMDKANEPFTESDRKMLSQLLLQKDLSKELEIGLSILLAAKSNKENLRYMASAYDRYRSDKEDIPFGLKFVLLTGYGNTLLNAGMPSRAKQVLEEARKISNFEKFSCRAHFLSYSDMMLSLIEINIRELNFKHARELAQDKIFRDYISSVIFKDYMFLGMDNDAEYIFQKYVYQEDLNALLTISRLYKNERIARAIVSRAKKLAIQETDPSKQAKYNFINTLNDAWNEIEFGKLGRAKAIAKALCDFKYLKSNEDTKALRMELASCLLLCGARAEAEKLIPSFYSNDEPASSGQEPTRTDLQPNEE